MTRSEIKIWIQQKGRVDFSRSGGPGGQYVNTSDTRVGLRVPLDSLPVTEQQRQRVLQELGNRITSEGELLIHSSETRSQLQNRELAEERACNLIFSALKPQKKSRPTRPSRAAQRRRLHRKKIQSEKKKRRNEPFP